MKLTGIIKRNTMSLTPEYTFMAGPEEARKKITFTLNKHIASKFEEEFLKGKESAKSFRAITIEFKAVVKDKVDSHVLADVIKTAPICLTGMFATQKEELIEKTVEEYEKEEEVVKPIRIYHLAKELKITNKELLLKLKEAGHEVKSSLSFMPKGTTQTMRATIAKGA